MEKVKEIIKKVEAFLNKYQREIIVCFFALCSVCVFFFTFGEYRFNGYVENPVNGFNIIFGYIKDEYTIYNPSVFGIITFAILLIGVGLPLLGLIKKNIYHYEMFILLVGIVMLILFPNYINHGSQAVVKYFYLYPTVYIQIGILSVSFLFSSYYVIGDYVKVEKEKKNSQKEATLPKEKKIKNK